jgi:hypothetical protein
VTRTLVVACRAVSAEHDSIIKLVLSQRQYVAELLASILPPELLARIDLDTLTPLPTESVDVSLSKRIADCRFSVRFREPLERYGVLQVIFEHQGLPEAGFALRVLEYIVRSWSDFARNHDGPVTALPPVLCVVISQHHRGWTAARRFHDLIPALQHLPELRRFVPDFELLVDDLSLLSDEALRERNLSPLPTLTLAFLRDSHNIKVLLGRLRAWARDVEALLASAPEDLIALLRYLLSISDGMAPEELVRRVSAILPQAKAPMTTAAQQLIARGEARGKAEGEAKGKAEGVLAIFEARGLPVAQSDRERILTCHDLPTLDRWLRAAVTCESVEAIFSH